MNQSRVGSAAVAAARSTALKIDPLRSVAHTTSRVERTKPTSPAGGLAAADLAILREAMEATRDEFPGDVARSRALKGAQWRSIALICAHRTRNSANKAKPQRTASAHPAAVGCGAAAGAGRATFRSRTTTRNDSADHQPVEAPARVCCGGEEAPRDTGAGNRDARQDAGNSKSQAPNHKQAPNSKKRNSKRAPARQFRILNLEL